MKVWQVTGKSESGDDYDFGVFKNKPSVQDLKELVSSESIGDDGWTEDPGDEEFPGYDDAGPGSFGSYIHLDVTEVPIIDN